MAGCWQAAVHGGAVLLGENWKFCIKICKGAYVMRVLVVYVRPDKEKAIREGSC